MTFEEAAAKILVHAPEPDSFDKRQHGPWTWALGPFGSWPVSIDEAMETMRREVVGSYELGDSFRLGLVVLYRDCWGFAAIPEVGHADLG